MQNILFVNACVRKGSRTRWLAEHLLTGLDGTVNEVRLSELRLPEADEAFLQKREACIERQDFTDPMFAPAKAFAAADIIVVAAPFWDLSFPAALKQYFEQITVTGITFSYTAEGIPQGLCRADRLYYVTTAGGTIPSEAYGYGYVKALAKEFYGIAETTLIKAEGLDIIGADEEEILRRAKDDIDILPVSHS